MGHLLAGEWGVKGWTSEEEEAGEVGEVTGHGLSPGTPTVRAAETAGPTAAAEGHREGDRGVHTWRAAREVDGGEAQLSVGAHWLRYRGQGGRQDADLSAGKEEVLVCVSPSLLRIPGRTPSWSFTPPQ